jgi:hypothetical protein
VRQDHAEAVKWYRLAADQGHATAQSNLGVKYENGEGVRQDHAEAVKCCFSLTHYTCCCLAAQLASPLSLAYYA